MTTHHKTLYQKRCAERYYQAYVLLDPAERTLRGLLKYLQEQGERVSLRTLARYSEKYHWQQRLHQDALADEQAGLQEVDKRRARARLAHYNARLTEAERATDELSRRVHALCLHCTNNLKHNPVEIRFCAECSAQLLRPLQVLVDFAPEATYREQAVLYQLSQGQAEELRYEPWRFPAEQQDEK